LEPDRRRAGRRVRRVATRIGGLLREGVSEEELTTFLEDARKGAMGLPADRDEDQRVAAAVRAWYAAERPAVLG
jgi:hypothetical protein